MESAKPPHLPGVSVCAPIGFASVRRLAHNGHHSLSDMNPLSTRTSGVALLAIGVVGLGVWAVATGQFQSGPPGPPSIFNVPDTDPGHGPGLLDGRPADHHGPYVGMDDRGYAVDPLDPECRGCSPHKHPTPLLTDAEFKRLKADYSLAPIDEQSESLDALLFYGPQFAFRLRTDGPAPLDAARTQFALTELSRHGVYIEMRVVDEYDVQRVTMPPTFWPFDIKQHYYPKGPELVRMQTPDINGTCKRVGLDHIWVRC